ncbi:MAB_1171c family putative transporter [Streptomyces sp. TS71-3]|uniref:MAB_1171c family putative transporter n=1 Tax=Streptomyces sp. TS71-3 TaxID=2733862 RepID=UPI001B21596F|nr:MAB_1171c family putative transporter [Streptomyces sp. TS71-3]GHJ35428.1 hypothetical protein Sm713_10370 [Streptomyces sp. TS71-3]
MTVADVADQVGRYSILLLWAALLVRARSAWKGHHQRGLWLAVLTAATATTLFLPEVIDWATGVTGDAHDVTLLRNLVGVLSAGLTLWFIVDSARGRRLHALFVVGLAAAVATLIGMDLAAGASSGPSIPPAGAATPSTAYWLIVCVAHLVTDVIAVLVCGRYSRRTDDRDLAWSLRLFATGSVLAVGYWAAYLVHVCLRIPAALPYMSLVIELHGVSRALTLLVPTATYVTRFARDARTVWVLWPMWRDLFVAVPTVALIEPQSSRFHAILKPRASMALQAHRQIIELYDAILDLQRFVHAQAYELARQHAERIRVPAIQTPAAALAGALGQARRAKLAGVPAAGPGPLPGLDNGDAALLLAIARSWPSMSEALPGMEPTPSTA